VIHAHPHPLVGEVAVPAAGAFLADGALALLTLASVLVCIVAYGLHEGWEHSIGWGLRWVANRIRGFAIDLGWFGGSIHPFDFLADALEWIDRGISNALATLYLDSEKVVVYLWHLTGIVFWWSVHETKALALDVYRALEHTIVVTIPDAAKWARRDAINTARTLTRREAALRRTADHEIRHLAHVAEAEAEIGIRKAEHALDWAEHEVGVLGRDIRGLRARLREIERRFGPAALTGLVMGILYKELGLGWTRCQSLKDLTKRRGCGAWSGLESLLAAVAAFGIAADFRDVVKAAVAIEGEAASALSHLASLDEAAIQDAAQAVADAANRIAA
jgi:hypothetical protein